MALTKNERRIRIKRRIRKSVTGTNSIPRLSVFRSNKGIYAQIITDEDNKTIVAASSVELAEGAAANKTEQATKVGELIAKKATEAGIETVVFDRNGYLYHGRIKSLADGARNGGLKF